LVVVVGGGVLENDGFMATQEEIGPGTMTYVRD
jgi:hypothetical protein